MPVCRTESAIDGCLPHTTRRWHPLFRSGVTLPGIAAGACPAVVHTPGQEPVTGPLPDTARFRILCSMTPELLLGTHVSVSGGLRRACERAESLGCTTMQIFTKNSNRWEGRPLSDEDAETYKTACGKSRIGPVFAHASYLINLAATNESVLRKSRHALEDELRRCEQLGLAGLIVHPGARLGRGEEEGLQRIIESLDAVHDRTAGLHTRTVLESTAGQGTSLGHRFEQLRSIIDRAADADRLAVCIDTCHLFAAGYPIHTEQGWQETVKEFDAVIGLPRLAAVHVNDSRTGFHSRVDRHQHIGKGEIGLECFRMLMNDPRFSRTPKILETDKSDDMHEDVENLALLRSLVR
jgi:deoxyribonuclease IV